MDAIVAQFVADEAIISEDARSTDFDVMMRELSNYALRKDYTEPIDVWSAVQALSKCGVKLSTWSGDEYAFEHVSLKGALLEWIKKQEIEKLEEVAKAAAKAARKKTTVRKTTATKRKVVVKSESDEEKDE